MQQAIKEEKGGYPVGHVGWNASSPDALHVALGQGVTDRVDSVGSELAVAVHIDTAEVVVVQATKGTHSKLGKQEKGGYPVGHVGWNASSPDALHIALGQGVADRVDGIEFERASSVDSAELVVVQAARGMASA